MNKRIVSNIHIPQRWFFKKGVSKMCPTDDAQTEHKKKEEVERFIETANAALDRKDSTEAISARKGLRCAICQLDDHNPNHHGLGRYRYEYQQIEAAIGVLIGKKTNTI